MKHAIGLKTGLLLAGLAVALIVTEFMLVAPELQPGMQRLPSPKVHYVTEGDLGAPFCMVDGKRKIAYSTEIDYAVNLGKEKYFVRVPETYDGKDSYGLIMYVPSASYVTSPPADWKEVLDRRKIIFVAPQHADNHCAPGKRMGLAVLGTLAMIGRYNIDSKRVYIAGLSGGAATACDLAFYQPDLFSGAIEDCGADFYRPVRKRHRTDDFSGEGYPYGLAELSAHHLPEIKRSVRFVLITGDNDFRHGNILDIFEDGFRADQFQVKLIDVPGMGHSDCKGDVLNQAIDYIENAPGS